MSTDMALPTSQAADSNLNNGKTPPGEAENELKHAFELDKRWNRCYGMTRNNKRGMPTSFGITHDKLRLAQEADAALSVIMNWLREPNADRSWERARLESRGCPDSLESCRGSMHGKRRVVPTVL